MPIPMPSPGWPSAVEGGRYVKKPLDMIEKAIRSHLMGSLDLNIVC